MKTIDIRTTQNVTIEYELASLRDRLLAELIDFVVIAACFIGLVIVLSGLLSGFEENNDLFLSVLFGLLPVLLFWGYHLGFEAFNHGQSLGKKSLGLRVMRLDGGEPNLGDYLLRASFLLLDGLFSLGILGIILISSSPRNQRLGDMTAGTTVLRTRTSQRFRLEDILGISSLEEYQPQYPEVRQLSEADMLLVKDAIQRYRTYRNSAHQRAVQELSEKLANLLDISNVPRDKIGFLRTLLRDYIVLTR